MRGHLDDRHLLWLLLVSPTTLAALAPATAAATAATAAAGFRLTAARGPGVDGISVQEDATTTAVRTRCRERFDQPGAQTLPGQLHQPQRRHLRHLMACPIPRQRLGQPSQHQIPVVLQNHVDEVDDDHAADVTQPQLPDDFLGSFQVVASDGLFEVPARSGELASVDIDNRHRLGAVDDQRAAGRQPHLAIHRLGELFVDPMHGEDVRARNPRRLGRFVLRHPRGQLRRHRVDVIVDRLPGFLAGNDQSSEVLVEQVADDFDQHVGLFVERNRRARGLLLGLGGVDIDLVPPLL